MMVDFSFFKIFSVICKYWWY